MKFSNGCWLQKEGVGCLSPAEVYFTTVEEKRVMLFAPTTHIAQRGNTLGGVCLSVEITSPVPEVIRIKTVHHKGAADNGPKFELNSDENCKLEVEDSEDTICIRSGNAGLVIDKKNWKMTYLNGEEKRCTSGWRDLAYMKTDWNGEAYALTNEDAYMRQQLSLGVGELVYGLGERFGAFTKNGQSVDIWNEDGGTSTEQSYKNIPFYISNKGYGIFVNHPEKVSFPEGMLKRIKAKGLRVCVWINPYIAQCSAMFAEGMEHGYFLKRNDGSVWQWDMWQPGMALVDFTNPDACRWYQGKLQALLDMGVDCFKTDFGERIPVVDCVYHNGMDAEKMHNYYTYLYNKVVYELLEEQRGKGEAVLFARSATVGGQKFPVHWGGDCWSDYESMEESLRGGLSLQMSGFGFWSHDIGGFESTSTPDVYKRWCAFGLLSSHSRLHGSTSYRVPWAYDEEAVDVVRFFTRLKAKLMPYLWKTALTAHNEGIPSMRALVLEFTKDKNTHHIDKQYMLGDSLMVAPVFNEDSIGEYYLPAVDGVWTNFFTGEEEEGGKWYSRTCGYCDIPLMAGPDSIVAVGAVEDNPEYDYGDGVTLRVFGLTAKAETSVYTMDQKMACTVTAEKHDGEIRIHIENSSAKNLVVELVNTDAVSAEGAEMEKKDKNILLKSCQADVTVKTA